MLGGFVFGALVIIEPLGGFHDSISNLYLAQGFLSGNLRSANVPYVFDFPGAYAFLGILLSVSGLDVWTLSRIFPIVAFAVYAPSFLALGTRFVPPRFGKTFPLYMAIAFAGLFSLRINPAPVTIAALVLVNLAVTLTKPRANTAAMRALAIILILAITITHPLTPFLILPLVFFFGDSQDWRRIGRGGVGLAVTSAALFVAWIAFLGGYTFETGVRLLATALSGESPESTGGFVIVGPAAQTTFTWINRTYLVLAAVTIAILLLMLIRTEWRRRTMVFLLISAPLSLVFYSIGFLTRFLSIESIVFALLLGYGFSIAIGGRGSPSQTANSLPMQPQVLRKKRAIALLTATLIIATSVLGLVVAYPQQSAFDRQTFTERAGFAFLASYTFSGTIYAGGIGGDPVLGSRIAAGYWGGMNTTSALKQTYILVTDQIANSFVLIQQRDYANTTLGMVEQELELSWQEVYDNGNARLYTQSNL